MLDAIPSGHWYVPFTLLYPYLLRYLMFLLLTKSVHFMHDYSWINNQKLSREKVGMSKFARARFLGNVLCVKRVCGKKDGSQLSFA